MLWVIWQSHAERRRTVMVMVSRNSGCENVRKSEESQTLHEDTSVLWIIRAKSRSDNNMSQESQ